MMVLLSREAFIESLSVLLASRLRLTSRWLHGRGPVRPWVQIATCFLVATLVLAAFGTLVGRRLHESYQGNYSGFLQLSRGNFDRNPILNNRPSVRRSLLLQEGGYDGQFMYFAIFDPFLRRYRDHPATYREFIDAPPYRFGRIGFSLLAKVFSGDRWQLYPVTMTWLILISLFLSGLALALAARSVGGSPAWGALILVIPGFWQSLQVALPEPVASALLLGGCLCAACRRWSWAGLLFAWSLLVRETGAILVLCLVVATLMSGKRREAIQVAAISLAPVLVWRLYIGWILFPDWGAEAFWPNPQNVGMPFAGILDLWARIHRGQYFHGASDLARAGIWYPVVLAGGFVLAATIAIRAPGAISVAAVLYGLIGISLTYGTTWVHVGNAQRATYEMFVMLALLSVGIRGYPRALQAALLMFWAGTAVYVFFGAYDARYIREAVRWAVF